MVWRFLKPYGVGKAGEVLDEFAAAVAAFDSESASKAQITMMQAELNKLSGRLFEVEAELRRAHRETVELDQRYRRYFEAAQVLQERLDRSQGDIERLQIEGSLARLVDRLEWLKPELAREQEEDREAETWTGKLRASFEDLAAKLDLAKGNLRSPERRLTSVKLRQQRLMSRDRKDAAAAGLTSAISAISVALDAMNKETVKGLAESEALKLKAEVMRGDRLENDPHIAAALGAASPKSVVDASSLRDRLARLEGRPAPPSVSAA